MKRKLQGPYKTISTVGEKVKCFVPATLPPTPPIDWTPQLRDKFDQAPATVNKSLNHLVELGIVRELTAKKRNRVFSYSAYSEILNKGTELPDARISYNFSDMTTS